MPNVLFKIKKCEVYIKEGIEKKGSLFVKLEKKVLTSGGGDKLGEANLQQGRAVERNECFPFVHGDGFQIKRGLQERFENHEIQGVS